MSWHAAYTEPRRETYAREQLVERGLRVFYPHEKVTRRVKARGRAVWVAHVAVMPVWPRYLFVEALCDRDLWLASGTRGVQELVRSAGLVLRVPDRAMDLLRGVADADGLTSSRDLSSLTKQLGWKVGDEVRVRDGAFAGHHGLIENLGRLDETGEIRVDVPLFGRVTRLSVGYADVEKVAALAA